MNVYKTSLLKNAIDSRNARREALASPSTSSAINNTGKDDIEKSQQISDGESDNDDDNDDGDAVEDGNDPPLIAATSPLDDLVAELFSNSMSPPPSGTLKGLYEYASGNLSHWSTISEVKRKSTMLALSGVLNTMDTEMMNINGFEATKAACLEDNFVSLSPDMRCLIDELVNAMGADKDIWKLKSFCREQQLNSTKNRSETSNRARIINIVEYLCTLIEIENWSESSSENEFVTVWRHIFSVLLSTTIAVRTGEIGLTETRSDRQKSEWLFTLNNHN
ncbi:hypothetical protein BGZ49_006227, partial [Haplosporangium sp. Z 27]